MVAVCHTKGCQKGRTRTDTVSFATCQASHKLLLVIAGWPFFIPAYPFWSLLIIAADIVALRAATLVSAGLGIRQCMEMLVTGRDTGNPR